MQNRTGAPATSRATTITATVDEHDRVKDPLPTRPPRPHPQSSATTAQIGPRTPGTVYDNASGAFRVLTVVTDPSEARRILRRNAAKFAVLVRDLHAGTEHYTGAVWTGSDRVIKAVA